MNPTSLYIFTAIIATGAYDIFCVYFTGPGKKLKQWPSISMGLAAIGPKAPWVYYVIGVVCGHLFFNMCQTESCIKPLNCKPTEIIKYDDAQQRFECVNAN